jgi:hypothetical protein
MSTKAVVEWAPFQIGAGVSDEELLAVSRRVQDEFLAHQPGFLRRDLLRWKNGCWVDIVYWADRGAADAALQAAADDATCHAYFRLMSGGDQAALDPGVLRFERVACYP